MARRSTYRFFLCLVGLVALGPAVPQAAEPLQMVLPVDCKPGKNCWIVNYVDHDPTTGLRDYTCGKATYNAPPGNRHKGTDFAIRDLAVMRAGVIVRASAPGTVAGARDGMKDVNVRKIGQAAVKGKECGDGVRIEHRDGWSTQYCHMLQGSIVVKKGTKVKAGQTLGLVGLSGLTEFPHLHIQVSKDKTVVDPFAGLKRGDRCRAGEGALWKSDVMASIPYQPTALFSAVISGTPPESDLMREGAYQSPTLSPMSPSLILWAGIYRLKAGDELTFTITGPDGKTVLKDTRTAKKNVTRRFEFRGVRRKSKAMKLGTYQGKITLVRKATSPGGPLKIAITRQVSVE
jgi:hypothetical protein